MKCKAQRALVGPQLGANGAQGLGPGDVMLRGGQRHVAVEVPPRWKIPELPGEQPAGEDGHRRVGALARLQGVPRLVYGEIQHAVAGKLSIEAGGKDPG